MKRVSKTFETKADYLRDLRHRMDMAMWTPKLFKQIQEMEKQESAALAKQEYEETLKRFLKSKL